MVRESEVELLKQMQNLRKRSGIEVIPFSDAEINSGMAAALSSAMGSRKPIQKSKPQQQFKTLRQELHTPPPAPVITQPIEEPEIPRRIGRKPLNHKRSFSLKC
ncbi:MAG: hypothetical protein HQL71_10445 [Magnetococcales bacterium]|nr:hypothetical protein [Magnetococcales bacterium]